MLTGALGVSTLGGGCEILRRVYFLVRMGVLFLILLIHGGHKPASDARFERASRTTAKSTFHYAKPLIYSYVRQASCPGKCTRCTNVQ